MIAIALGQMIMSFNVASLPVALGGMVESFGVPPTTIATAIVSYSMLVAGFVMLGAKLAQRYGAAFQDDHLLPQAAARAVEQHPFGAAKCAGIAEKHQRCHEPAG